MASGRPATDAAAIDRNRSRSPMPKNSQSKLRLVQETAPLALSGLGNASGWVGELRRTLPVRRHWHQVVACNNASTTTGCRQSRQAAEATESATWPQPTSMHPLPAQCLTLPTLPNAEAIRSLIQQLRCSAVSLVALLVLSGCAPGHWALLGLHGQPAVCRSLKFAAQRAIPTPGR